MKKEYSLLVILFYLFTIFFSACTDEDKNNPWRNKNPEEEVDDDYSEISEYYRDGITKVSDNTLVFVLYAPHKEEVHLIGDFNNWTANETSKMTKDGPRFWIQIDGLEKGKEYICQYLIDGELRVADPYTEKTSDPLDVYIDPNIYPTLLDYPSDKTTEIAMVVNTDRTTYPWKISDFKIENPESMVIYELLLRDFTEEGSVKAAQEKLDYLKELGVNAIELMPFNEFEGNDSWGYNPSFYFATDKAYGTSEDYKTFIDECHSRNMAVIMDIVLNHSYTSSPMVRMYFNGSNPTAENPWYNQSSNFANPDAQWGHDFNHDSKYTQAFVDSVCSYWVQEYKIDGFRFDFTKGFSNTPYPATEGDTWGSAYDADRIKNLKRIYDEIKKRNPNALMICEHLADNSEEKELADYGLYMWGNLNDPFMEATMGWGEYDNNKGDVTWGSYQARNWNKPVLITYMESHDEERVMFKNLAYGGFLTGNSSTDLATALKRTEAAAVILMSIPGPKMIWQFGEMGYDYELNNDRLGKKPARWDYLDDPDRKHLNDVYASLIQLRNTNPIFKTSDYETDLVTNFKQVLLKDGGSSYVCAIANFDLEERTETVNFGTTGTWNDYFSTSTITNTEVETEITLQPGEYHLYIRP